MNVAIIGSGAAGCLAAIQIKRNNPKVNVTVYEAGIKPLIKVAVTGGGRYILLIALMAFVAWMRLILVARDC